MSCVCLDPAESGFKGSNKHPHRCETHTWHSHIPSCRFHSVILQMDASLNLPHSRLYHSGRGPNASPPADKAHYPASYPTCAPAGDWFNRKPRTRSNMAALRVCANVTKWKVMQIGDLKTSRPLLHPVASNVSLAEKFPACFSCTAIHLSTAWKCLFSVLLSSYLHECTWHRRV